jgi:hypothetical protein
MPLKPWYKVVTPREDLREGRPLDASEFAVHLDKVRDRTAPEDYRDPKRFFDRTYMATNLLSMGSEVLRRLSGIKTETSAVFNLATQFGGGKTHALTMLYHLALNGRKAEKWTGVERLMNAAKVEIVPQAAVATFVGTEFDSITGRGGADGTPLRKTPWGEIAWQLGKKSFKAVAAHEQKMVAPAGDVIRQMLPKDRPCLILIDELLNYVSRNRKSGLSTQLYDFLQNLSETTRGEDQVVLAVSIPASELEMTAEDQADYTRFKKMLDRLGKPIVMAAEHETSEIIRRRLFEWGGLPEEGRRVAAEYADWIIEHRELVPKWFPVDNAREAVEESYPFHPTALSVFERKWQELPRFQQTRGILRLLALWVSRAYQEGYKGNHKDPLIGLGTAPLQDSLFRTALCEQLGEQKLEGAITTDICGKKESHATRLDAEAVDTLKKARLHRKVSTVIFFESNGGQAREGEATIPEIRLAVAEPGLDVGNTETALEALSESCYYLRVQRNRYRFGLAPNLNKLLADRRANIAAERIEERIREEMLKVFDKQPGVELVPFPEKSGQVPDRPVLSLVILLPECTIGDQKTVPLVEKMIREHGNSGRTFKSALLFAIAEDDAALRDEARKLLAWQDIKDEEEDRLDQAQQGQLAENLKKAQRDLKECVWRTYKNVALLGKNNQLRVSDLGLVHSSQAKSLVELIVDRLRQEGDVEKSISPSFLIRNWPPALPEWSTKAVRDAFFASPQFPRLLNPDSIKEAIARGVSGGILAYVGKRPDGGYEPFFFETELAPIEVEISDEVFLISAEEAKKHIEPATLTSLLISPERQQVKPGTRISYQVKGLDQHGQPMALADASWTAKGGEIDSQGRYQAGPKEGEYPIEVRVRDLQARTVVVVTQKEAPAPPPQPPSSEEVNGLKWVGEVPAQKWMNFYTKVLAKHVNTGGLKVTVGFEVVPDGGVLPQRLEETKAALRELGLDDGVEPVL